jgi:hypothetical protein
MSIIFHLDKSGIDELTDWFVEGYGLDHVFEFSIHDDRLLASHYKVNSDGNRYLVCAHHGKLKGEDDCRELTPAAETVDLLLTLAPPFPVSAGRVRRPSRRFAGQ